MENKPSHGSVLKVSSNHSARATAEQTDSQSPGGSSCATAEDAVGTLWKRFGVSTSHPSTYVSWGDVISRGALAWNILTVSPPDLPSLQLLNDINRLPWRLQAMQIGDPSCKNMCGDPEGQ